MSGIRLIAEMMGSYLNKRIPVLQKRSVRKLRLKGRGKYYLVTVSKLYK